MHLLKKFKEYLQKENLFQIKDRLLIAVSGGVDSVVLCELTARAGFRFIIAHCNFQLRGLESFGDQKFVQDYAEANSIPVFVTQFDTEAFAKDYKLSTQVAARELRYSWFYELLEIKKFDFILTAHHADDNLETFIINLTRGTGISGLHGILPRRDRLIRPLLFLNRQEINEVVNENDLSFVEDSSNLSTNYTRNKIRLEVIPHLQEINPNLEKTSSQV